MANVVTTAGGGVGARDVLAVDVGHNRDMLTNGQVQEVLLMRQSKFVPVMGLHMCDASGNRKITKAISKKEKKKTIGAGLAHIFPARSQLIAKRQLKMPKRVSSCPGMSHSLIRFVHIRQSGHLLSPFLHL